MRATAQFGPDPADAEDRPAIARADAVRARNAGRSIDRYRGRPYVAHRRAAKGIGAVAQLGERCVRNAEVRGSTPLGSTTRRIVRRNLALRAGNSSAGRVPLQRFSVEFDSETRGLRWPDTPVTHQPWLSENQIVLDPVDQRLGRAP